MEIIVIGGVAAGMSAATKLKRNLGDNVNIVVFEKGSQVSFGACGIPFYISDKIKEADDLIAKKPEEFLKSGIDVRIHHEVLSVNTDKKEVTVLDIDAGKEFTAKYDKLIIGSGAGVRTFPPFNEKYDNLYKIRDVQDGVIVKTAIKTAKSILVVGAGFIGLEIVEACRHLDVTLVELSDRILMPMDSEVTDVLTKELIDNKVNVKTSSKVTKFISENGIIKKAIIEHLGKEEEISIDMVINCAGIAPETSFITNVEKAPNGAIIVDESMQTNITDVYAAGDCSIMKGFITGNLTYAPLGTNANKQGRIIADTIGGKEVKPFKLVGASAIKLFSFDAAKVGLSENDAKNAGIDYKVNIITGNSYASYYSKEKVTIKVIYDAKTRKILGAQAVGQGIVVPRANYYAIAIYSGLTVDEFGFMDLCYSPPFGGVWDASLIAANTAK